MSQLEGLASGTSQDVPSIPSTLWDYGWDWDSRGGTCWDVQSSPRACWDHTVGQSVAIPKHLCLEKVDRDEKWKR